MLFASDTLQVQDGNGEISCLLCKHCLAALANVDYVKKPQKMARMPVQARANGLWHGPDPTEISALTYTECKVINLARVYVSVKRIFLDRRSFAATSSNEAPRYHQNNVVAYPHGIGMQSKRSGTDIDGAIYWW